MKFCRPSSPKHTTRGLRFRSGDGPRTPARRHEERERIDTDRCSRPQRFFSDEMTKPGAMYIRNYRRDYG
jgi:hypothetical protein